MLRVGLFALMFLLATDANARDATAEEYIERTSARLAILDKITARVHTIELHIGETIQSGSLMLNLNRCAETPMEFTPEAVAFVALREQIAENMQPKSLFDGWIFASSPSLSALEHPIYDVWLVECFDTAESVLTTKKRNLDGDTT